MKSIFSSRCLLKSIIGLCFFSTLLILIIIAQLLGLLDKPSAEQATINVPGIAKVFSKPDIAVFNFGAEAENLDVSVATEKSAETINKIHSYLLEVGVAEADIKTTTYNVYPRYHYPDCRLAIGVCDNERKLQGYVVSQRVTVKVREFDQIGTIIGGLGERGATNIGGLEFMVDNREELLDEARLKAIADAKERATKIASEIDSKLGRVVGVVDVDSHNFYQPVASMVRAEFSLDSASVPSIQGGEQEIVSRVTVTYQLK